MNEKEKNRVQDLRSFIQDVKKLAPEELVEINERVNPADYEVNTFLDIFREKGKFPIILFNNVSKLNKERFSGSLITSADPGSYKRAAVAFGLELDETSSQNVVEELGRRAQNPLKPVVVGKNDAPVKQIVKRGEECDIGDLPLLMDFEEDAKPGWFTPIVSFL